MPKIIIVSGIGNTGKTSSIKQAMKKLGVHVSTARPTTDVLLSTHLHLDGSGHHVGFATGGDTVEVVEANIVFLHELDLDYMVFACRSNGHGFDRLKAYAKSLGVEPIWIKTTKAQIPEEAIAHTAQSIVNNIP